MNQAELFGVVQQVNDQYANLITLAVSVNFAMIVGIWVFLHRARMAFRVAAFAFYLVGMLSVVGMMLIQANLKAQANLSLAAIPDAERAGFITAYLELQQSWLFIAVSAFLNLSLWAMVAVVAWLLFFWKGEHDR